jgi:hypothetical protein
LIAALLRCELCAFCGVKVFAFLHTFYFRKV